MDDLVEESVPDTASASPKLAPEEPEAIPPVPSPATIPSGSNNGSTLFGWRRRDQLAFGGLLIVALVLIVVHWVRLSGWGLRPVEVDRQETRAFEYRLDINRANWVEWNQLPGVGDQLARRIVAYRDEQGPFRSIDELRNVRGIGPKTLEKLCPWLEDPSAPEVESAQNSRRKEGGEGQ